MSTISNPEIDRLIDQGEFQFALQQPVRRPEGQDRRLESIMLGPSLSDGATEDLAYASVTLGKFLSDYIRIDPVVVHGIDFARHQDLHN
jgi:hypothetical protein